MKMYHIYFYMHSLFFLLSFNIVYANVDSQHLFDCHKEDLNTKKHIEIQKQEFLKKYRKLKQQLLETFKVHKDNPEVTDKQNLDEEDIEKNPQSSIQNEQEQKDKYLHYVDNNQHKPFVLITIQSNNNKPIHLTFGLEAAIAGFGQAIFGWLGGGAALTAAEIAAMEAAKVTATNLAASAVSVVVVGSAIKGQIDKKNHSNSKNHDHKSSQSDKASELKRDQEFKEQLNKIHLISSLEKTNPAQAQKEKEELQAWIARVEAQDKKNKFLENIGPNLTPSLERVLVDAGIIENPNSPGITIIHNHRQNTEIPNKTSTSHTTPVTEVKASNVMAQQSTTSQTPTPSQIPTQKKTLPSGFIRESFTAQNPFITAPNFSFLNPDIRTHVSLNKKHQTDSVLKQHINNNVSSGSPTPPDNDPNDDEKNKKEKIKSKRPNGIYEENPKHHQNAKGNIGKCPKDGQKTLDNAIQVEGQFWKVSIEGDNFVIFEEHLPGKWHGYIVENPTKMHQAIKNLLFEKGWVRSVNNLKIIKKF
ncbi:hypothetical protein KBD08_03995 [Candidatus Babeliales bacterium]|nr:hypothetical protein [Candidatus Babeliales bacterium]